jgi:hypothetical protein
MAKKTTAKAAPKTPIATPPEPLKFKPRKPSSAPTRQTVFTLGKRSVNRYDLYELAVQAPAMEAAFLRAVHGTEPETLGEDFCGPASVARAWCAMGERFDAVAVDKDPEPLEHAARRAEQHDETHVVPISKRLKLKEIDVMAARDKCDVIAALNFALCELHQRRWLMTYLRTAAYRLRAGGVLVADVYAGPDSMAPGTTERHVPTDAGTLVYRWEQRKADPLTARVENAIHFVLPGAGGKSSEKSRTYADAFVYHWRLWSVAELREAMLEAGFNRTEVYTSYGDAMDGDGNLYVRPFATDDEPGDPEELDENHVVYVVGRV